MLRFITWDEVDQVSFDTDQSYPNRQSCRGVGGITVDEVRGARLSGKGSKAGRWQEHVL